MACSLCGVKPMCAITGMPAPVIAAICAAQRRPPSSFTAWQPPSFMNRTAVRSAWVGPSSYEPNGRSPTTSARLVAPDHGADQREQLVDGDRQGGLVAEDVVGGRVADQQHRDAGLVEDRGGVLVVQVSIGPPLAALLGGDQVAGADPPGRPGRRRGRAPRRTGLHHVSSLLEAALRGPRVSVAIVAPGDRPAVRAQCEDFTPAPTPAGHDDRRLSRARATGW